MPSNAGDTRDSGLIPGLGRSPGGRTGNPLQYFCLENSMGRGYWWATVLGVANNHRTEQLSMHTGMQGEKVALVCKSLELPEVFWQSIFKGQVRESGVSGVNSISPEDLGALGGCAHSHKKLTSFIRWGILTSAKQLRNFASNTVI